MSCGTYKYKENPVKELPGCDIYSIRQRPRNFPKNDINNADWNIVCWNIEKKSPHCQITTTGDTREDAINTMIQTLKFATEHKINTYNGIPGSGIINNPKPTDANTSDYKISPESFYKINIKYGPWKPKKAKAQGGHNNNCGRQQIHQEMRKILVSIELKQLREVKEESRG